MGWLITMFTDAIGWEVTLGGVTVPFTYIVVGIMFVFRTVHEAKKMAKRR